MWWMLFCDHDVRIVADRPEGECGPDLLLLAFGVMPLCNDEPELS